jgi:hypothetical protein
MGQVVELREVAGRRSQIASCKLQVAGTGPAGLPDSRLLQPGRLELESVHRTLWELEF